MGQIDKFVFADTRKAALLLPHYNSKTHAVS
jgi:hypothetical protein